MKRTPIALIAPLLLASASVAPAASILIDFGQSSLETTGADDSHVWNNFSGTGGTRFADATTTTPLMLLNDLKDTTGAPTGVSLEWVSSNVAGVAGSRALGGYSGTDYDVATTTGYPLDATRDFITLTDGSNDDQLITATLRLSGLTANGIYDLTFFAGVAGSTRAQTLWSAGGATVGIDPDNNTETVTLSGVQADDAGVIVFTWSNDTTPGAFDGPEGDTALWNTFEITYIPEPSSTALVGAALAFGCFTRRRR